MKSKKKKYYVVLKNIVYMGNYLQTVAVFPILLIKNCKMGLQQPKII